MLTAAAPPHKLAPSHSQQAYLHQQQQQHQMQARLQANMPGGGTHQQSGGNFIHQQANEQVYYTQAANNEQYLPPSMPLNGFEASQMQQAQPLPVEAHETNIMTQRFVSGQLAAYPQQQQAGVYPNTSSSQTQPQQPPPPPPQQQNNQVPRSAPHLGPNPARLNQQQPSKQRLPYMQQLQQQIPVRQTPTSVQQQQQGLAQHHQQINYQPQVQRSFSNTNRLDHSSVSRHDQQQQQQQAQHANQVQQQHQTLSTSQQPSGDLILHHGEQQYITPASNATTLLQQQLNHHQRPSQQRHQINSQRTQRNHQLDTHQMLEQTPHVYHHNQQQQQQQQQQQKLMPQTHSQHHQQQEVYYPQNRLQPATSHHQPPPMKTNPRLAPIQQMRPHQQHVINQQQHVEQHHLLCNPTPPLTPNASAVVAPQMRSTPPLPPPSLPLNNRQMAASNPALLHPNPHHSHHQHLQLHDDWQNQSIGAGGNYGPANGEVRTPLKQANHASAANQYHPTASTAPPASSSSQAPANFIATQQMIEPQQQQQQLLINKQMKTMSSENQVIRLTLPLRDATLVGPFRLEHGIQFTQKSFHLRPQLFDTLSKSMVQQQQQTSAVIQELQLRAYLVNNEQLAINKPQHGDSLLASNRANTLANHTNACHWPDLFQVSCNQQLVHLERSPQSPLGAHKAANLFPYCQLGDNQLELQVQDCYCSHEFVLELVDRPTLRAFMNSCFKSRLLSAESCLIKLRNNFGTPGFLAPSHPNNAICNEYLTDYLPSAPLNNHQQQLEQTRARISLKCPLQPTRRMRTPTRGPHCKHLQCFDLENFLLFNREQTRWNCPICQQPIPFNMLELDQYQMNILQQLVNGSDDILIDSLGHWQAYVAPSQTAYPQSQSQLQTTKTNGTFHPQTQMARTPKWDQNHQSTTTSLPTGQGAVPIRRAPANVGAPSQRQRTNGASPPQTKRAHLQYSGSQAASSSLAGSPTVAPPPPPLASDDLSPLAAMERAIHHHEQQMGPPPFDTNLLASSPLRPTTQAAAAAAAATSPTIPPHSQVQSQAQTNQHQPSPSAVGAHFASPHHQQHQPSPLADQSSVSSPARQVPAASPQQQPQTSFLSSNSMPATPLLQGAGPETPATPGQTVSQATSNSHASSGNGNNCDHQPLSNGSASVASITSSSTLTPGSGQSSLGSVGMGGDSRCNTAPLAAASNSSCLDDPLLSLMPNVSQTHSNSQDQIQLDSNQSSANNLDSLRDQKSEILMSKLMMEEERQAGTSNELALALEEAEWKQQLDRGKSQHLANFLNEPMMMNMNKRQQEASMSQHHQHLSYTESTYDKANKTMLSGGLLPSEEDDQLNPSFASSSPLLSSPHHFHSNELSQQQANGQQHGHVVNQQQPLDSYASYLDSQDDGAGLPPDDSILDLFER